MKKSELQGLKKLKIFGGKYVIRRINPLLDFTYDKMPQIFTHYISKRPVDTALPHPAQLQRNFEDMKLIVQAGVVEPKLVPVGKGEAKGKEDGITVEDLFVDMELGTRLYLEIFAHSLNRFRGLKGLFFSIKIRHLLFMLYRSNTPSDRLMSYVQKAITQ